MSNIDKQAIDFSKPLETESGEPVKHICHDVIEYKCARVCVDVTTGVVYSSPYVGLKIRNKEASPRAKLREQVESAADAYRQFDNGWISEMKCGDLSHEYLLFMKEPKNVLALLDELETKEEQRANWFQMAQKLGEDLDAAEKRIAELEAKLETADKLQDGAFRNGLKAGFSYGQTDDQSGFAQCMSAYSPHAGIGKGE